MNKRGDKNNKMDPYDADVEDFESAYEDDEEVMEIDNTESLSVKCSIPLSKLYRNPKFSLNLQTKQVSFDAQLSTDEEEIVVVKQKRKRSKRSKKTVPLDHVLVKPTLSIPPNHTLFEADNRIILIPTSNVEKFVWCTLTKKPVLKESLNNEEANSTQYMNMGAAACAFLDNPIFKMYCSQTIVDMNVASTTSYHSSTPLNDSVVSYVNYSREEKGYDGFRWLYLQNALKNLPPLKEIFVDLLNVSPTYSLAHCVAEDMCMYSGIAVGFRYLFLNIHQHEMQLKSIKILFLGKNLNE